MSLSTVESILRKTLFSQRQHTHGQAMICFKTLLSFHIDSATTRAPRILLERTAQRRARGAGRGGRGACTAAGRDAVGGAGLGRRERHHGHAAGFSVAVSMDVICTSLGAPVLAHGDGQPTLAKAPDSHRIHMRTGTKQPPMIPPMQPPPQPPGGEAGGGNDGGGERGGGGEGNGVDGGAGQATVPVQVSSQFMLAFRPVAPAAITYVPIGHPDMIGAVDMLKRGWAGSKM